MTTPTTYEELVTVLQDRLEEFAPGQRRIADLLLSDPEGTALRTIGETARLSEIHESSVVRFAGSLGLKGYPALVALCRDHLAKEAHLIARFGRAQEHSADGDLLSATLEYEQQNLARTFSRITPQQWDHAVRALADAAHIHVMGLRKCLPVAQLMHYLLHLMRPRVHLVAPLAGMLADELRDLDQADTFVAISIRRYTAATVQAFEEAKRRGLATVVFTDDPGSPLAKGADVAFLVDCEAVSVLRSVGSFIPLAQSLATAVGIHRGTQSREELLSDERLLKQFSVYWS
jgi:DNA-binding MurR/RpiR family transcriptional regulator